METKADVIHRIRGALQLIYGQAELVVDTTPPAQLKDGMDEIRRQASSIAADLLKLN